MVYVHTHRVITSIKRVREYQTCLARSKHVRNVNKFAAGVHCIVPRKVERGQLTGRRSVPAGKSKTSAMKIIYFNLFMILPTIFVRNITVLLKISFKHIARFIQMFITGMVFVLSWKKIRITDLSAVENTVRFFVRQIIVEHWDQFHTWAVSWMLLE